MYGINIPNFVFIIETNMYAGNFEREMTAYLTGQKGDCEVGSEFAGMFRFDEDADTVQEFEDIIEQLPDEHGCFRPTSLWGPKSEDVAIFFSEEPSDEIIKIMKARAKKFGFEYERIGRVPMNNRGDLKIKGFKMEKYTYTIQEISV